MRMLIDARNCMYRAVYASDSEARREHKPPKHPLLIMLRLINHWIRDHKPTSIQIFWDAPRDTVWRKKILDGYKLRDMGCHWIKDLAEDMGKTQAAAQEIFSHLGVYQFYKERMEADDLIYAACKLQHDRPMLICSSDADMAQIQYHFSSVTVFNPGKGAIEDRDQDCNPVIRKALMGDKSDKIPGYPGIGPKKSLVLARDLELLEQFLKDNGRRLFLRNLMLIDLAMCPYLLHNQAYVARVLGTPVGFSREGVLEAAKRHRVKGLQDDYGDLIAQFKRVSRAPALCS